MNLEELNSSEVSRINNKEHIQFFPDELVFKAYFLRSVPDCFFPLTCLLSPIRHSVQAVNPIVSWINTPEFVLLDERSKTVCGRQL